VKANHSLYFEVFLYILKQAEKAIAGIMTVLSKTKELPDNSIYGHTNRIRLLVLAQSQNSAGNEQ
jgi:hypothetical protein